MSLNSNEMEAPKALDVQLELTCAVNSEGKFALITSFLMVAKM